MLEIKVLGRKISVRYILDKELQQMADDVDCCGYFDGRDTVFLSSSLTQEQAKRVFLHELTHIVFSITGLTHLFTDQQEEAACDAMESLIEVFRDSNIVKFLNNGEE